MGGTPHGLHSIVLDYAGVGAKANHAAMGAAFYKAFEHLQSYGVCERVASYTSGTGFDYPDGVNPCSNDWFLVYRWPLSDNRPDWFYEIMIEGHDSGGIWADTGENWTPSLLNGTDNGGSDSNLCIGAQVAVGFDSSGVATSPWTGTTNFDGSDYKGATSGVEEAVWDVSGGTTHVFPRRNASGGAAATYRQSNAGFLVSNSWNSTSKRLHVISDSDSLYIGVDYENDGSVGTNVLVTPYTPLDGILVLPPSAPLTYSQWETLAFPTDYGTDNGGVIAPNPGQVLTMNQPVNFLWPDSDGNPNNQRSDTRYDEASPIVWVNETSYYGYLGKLWGDFARFSYGITHLSTLDNMTRVVMGSSASSYKPNVPWDGVTANPAGTSDENGIGF